MTHQKMMKLSKPFGTVGPEREKLAGLIKRSTATAQRLGPLLRVPSPRCSGILCSPAMR